MTIPRPTVQGAKTFIKVASEFTRGFAFSTTASGFDRLLDSIAYAPRNAERAGRAAGDLAQAIVDIIDRRKK